MRTRGFLAAVSVLALAACGGDSTSPHASATGTWNGTMTSSDVAGTTLRLVLVENGGTVTGSGSFGGANVPVQVTVTGTFASPQLALTLDEGGLHPPAALTGTVNGNTLTGEVNGSGFLHDPITLTR